MDYDVVDEELIADGALSHYRVLIWLEGDVMEGALLQKLAAWVENGGVLVRLGAARVQTVEGSTSAGDALLGLSPATTLHNILSGPALSLEFKDIKFLRHASLPPVAEPHEQCAAALSPAARPLITAKMESGQGVLCWAVRHQKGWTEFAGRAGLSGRRRFSAATPSCTGPSPANLQPDPYRMFENLTRDVVYNLSALDPSQHDAVEVRHYEFDGVYCTLMSTGEVILHQFTALNHQECQGHRGRRRHQPSRLASCRSVLLPKR